MSDSATPFLTAEWRHLAMLNYEVDRAVLVRRVPAGTELDTWHGRALVSLVGFQFLDTRVHGIAFPGHRDFVEVNLRFYVRRAVSEGAWRRGVVFIREIVPRRAIAAVARWWYGEPYVRHAVRGELDRRRLEAGGASAVRYAWRCRGRWLGLVGQARGAPAAFATGSEAEFISEHYWGYTRRRAGTAEYRVEHRPWRVWALADARLEGDVAGYFGPDFAGVLRGSPRSAFLAEGSTVRVYRAGILPVDGGERAGAA